VRYCLAYVCYAPPHGERVSRRFRFYLLGQPAPHTSVQSYKLKQKTFSRFSFWGCSTVGEVGKERDCFYNSFSWFRSKYRRYVSKPIQIGSYGKM